MDEMVGKIEKIYGTGDVVGQYLHLLSVVDKIMAILNDGNRQYQDSQRMASYLSEVLFHAIRIKRCKPLRIPSERISKGMDAVRWARMCIYWADQFEIDSRYIQDSFADKMAMAVFTTAEDYGFTFDEIVARLQSRIDGVMSTM